MQLFQKFTAEGPYCEYYSDEEQKMVDYYEKVVLGFFEHHTRRIWVLQIKMLQYECSDLFEKKIFKLLHKTTSEFYKGKDDAINEIEQIFKKTAKGHDIPELGKTIEKGCLELRQVLYDYTEKIKESPTAELLNLDRINKEILTKGLKTKSTIVGFGLTTAIRLLGHGNFQIISSHGFGPHIFNFSVVNDRLNTEQDTKNKVKPFRFQPSLNFDVRI